MTTVLLDHPWPLQAARDPRSEGSGVLMTFVKLVRSYQLSVAPFIEREDFLQINCWSAPRTSGLSAIKRSAHLYVRWIGGSCSASPRPEPPSLMPAWKCALRDAMADIEDWRNPQIVVSERRRRQWPGIFEIDVYRDPCEHDAIGTGPHSRVIAVLESYSDHPFALSDFDPWNQERLRSSAARGRARDFPCHLPTPPIVNVRASLSELDQMVNQARDMAQRWENDGKYYFIPPADWQAIGICKEDWRNGAFRKEWLNGRRGPVDYMGRVWCWAEQHGSHWDVQQIDGGYMNINHAGERLS